MMSRPLTVALYSQDRTLLRDLSWFLTSFGYQVLASATEEPVAWAIEHGNADMFVADGDAIDLDASPLLDRVGEQRIPTIVLCDAESVPSAVDAAESGITDLVIKPVCKGELLARLRSAARLCEFDRRCEEQSTRDELTGLLSRVGFVTRWEKQKQSTGPLDRDGVLYLVDVDWFRQIIHRYGRQTGDQLLQAIAKNLPSIAGGDNLVARLGNDRFAIACFDAEGNSAAQIAETIRTSLSEIRVEGAPGPLPMTACVAFGSFDVASDELVELLDVASEALVFAKQSGRNMVVQIGEFDAAHAEWRREVREGNPFVDTTARDVMQPFPGILATGQESTEAARRVRQSALQYVPVVDSKRALVGVLQRDDFGVEQLLESGQTTVTEGLALEQPATVSEKASFGDVLEGFVDESTSYLVVVRNKEPRGIITRNSFLNLIEPVLADTYRPERPCSVGSQYLAVPDVIAEECLAQ